MLVFSGVSVNYIVPSRGSAYYSSFMIFMSAVLLEQVEVQSELYNNYKFI